MKAVGTVVVIETYRVEIDIDATEAGKIDDAIVSAFVQGGRFPRTSRIVSGQAVAITTPEPTIAEIAENAARERRRKK